MGLFSRIQRRLSPFHEYMDAANHRLVKKTPPFATGTARFLDMDITYSDGEGFLHSIEEIFYENVYKFEAKTEAPHIIDAGANIGLSVIYFKKTYPKATIVAYEPDARIFGILERNLQDYSGIELHQAAAWIDDTDLTFYSEGSLAGSSEVDFARKGVKTVVKARRLKDELRRRPVDFLKIDIEGAENSVIFDIEDELKNVGLFFFEYHCVPGKEQLLGDLLNLVSRAGFRYIINGARAPRLPFLYTTGRGFDMQLNVSCYREPAA